MRCFVCVVCGPALPSPLPHLPALHRFADHCGVVCIRLPALLTQLTLVALPAAAADFTSLPCCQVNGRIIRKRIHVRIEHVQPSRCREDFLRRRETNDRIKHEAKVKGGE